jgi:uncharacterized protein YwqG
MFKWLFGKAKRNAGPARDPAERASAVVAQLESLAQPCLRMSAGGPGHSRLGGVPNLRSPWPRYEGRPLCCVAQLDLAEMRAAGGPDWLPDDGRLIFFYELKHGAWGIEASDAGSSVVVYETGDRTQTIEPSDLPEEARFPAYPLRFAAATSLPPEERLGINRKGLTRAEKLAIEAAVEALQPAEPVHQVGGFPQPVQGDDMEVQCQSVTQGAYLGGGDGSKKPERMSSNAADWRLLLQLDTDNDAGMMWGDTGMLYFWIREQDARAGEFSKIWMILQCC